MIQTFDFKLVRGDTIALELKIFNEAGQEYNLQGKTIHFTARKTATDNNALIYKQIVGQTGNTALITLTSQETANIPQGTREVVYDVRVQDVSELYTVLTGKISVVEPITRL